MTAAGFVTCCITVLSLRVSVFPWDMCSALLPVEPANEKAAAASPSLGRDPGSLDTGFGPRGQADVVQEQNSWRNKPHSSPQLIDRDEGIFHSAMLYSALVFSTRNAIRGYSQTLVHLTLALGL